jgi:hypothetical protein
MVQAAFHDPVASLERKHPLGLEFFQGEAAEQVDHFTAPLAIAFNPGL